MKIRFICAAAIAVTLSSCQSSKNMQWVQFQYGDPFEIADAKCRMMANTQQQGIYARGSTEFVIGAQLGNAIANGIRMEQFYQQCMVISGWKRVPLPKPVPAAKVKAKKT